MTKYDFLKLHWPNLLPEMNAMCPSDIGLPDSKWRRGSKRCPGCNLATTGCWIYPTPLTDDELETAERFIVNRGMTYRQFIEIHFSDKVDHGALGGVIGCPRQYGIKGKSGCSVNGEGKPTEKNMSCTKCWDIRFDYDTYHEAIRRLLFSQEKSEKENESMQPNETCPTPDGPVEIINVLKSADPAVENPSHYEFSKFSPIKVIRAWGLNFNLGSAVK